MKKLLLVLLVATFAFGQSRLFIPWGGVNAQTTSYQVLNADVGKLVVMNGSSLTATLPATPPNTQWTVLIKNANASALSVSPNGKLLDGSSGAVSVGQNQGLYITTDGTNYFSQAFSTGAGGSSAFGTLTAGNNSTAAMQVSGAASIGTSGTGIIAANQAYLPIGILQPTLTSQATGGSLLSNHVIAVRITYNTALGESGGDQASGEATVTATSCTGGNQCSIVVSHPTTAQTGVTSWNVYSCDRSASPGCAVAKQTASNNCSAISLASDCTIQVVGAGAAVPATNTAWLAAPTPYAGSLCPPNVQPTMYNQDSAGTWQSVGGIDNTNTANQPPANASGGYGVFTFCQKLAINDTASDPIVLRNNLFTINHLSGTGTRVDQQDRAVGILFKTPTNDTTTRYGMEGMMIEFDLNGQANINGSPDGETTSFAGVFGDFHTNTSANKGPLGVNAIRASYFRELGAGNYGSCTGAPCMNAVFANASNISTVAGASNAIASFHAQTKDVSGTANAMQGYGLYVEAPGSSRFGTSNYGIYTEAFGNNANDWNIFSNGTTNSPTSSRNFFGGNVYLPNILTNSGTIGVTGSFNAYSYALQQITGTTSLSLTNQGTPGATSYTYKVFAKDAAGGADPNATQATTATGNATLNGSNFNRIQIIGGQVLGASCYDVYRTASGGTPATTGKIGQVCAVSAGVAPTSTLTFDDTGLAGDGVAIPAVNTTGGILGPEVATDTRNPASGFQKAYFKASAGLCALDSSGVERCTQTAVGAAANQTLSNLTATTQVNQDLAPQTAGANSVGIAARPWSDLWFAGTSGTPASNNGRITGSFTGARVFTFPDVTTTIAGLSGTQTFDGTKSFNALALVQSSTANPAAAGWGRLAKTDVVNFRNNANGADVLGLGLDSDDAVKVGGTAGTRTQGTLFVTGSGTPLLGLGSDATCAWAAGSGQLQLCNVTGVLHGNNNNTGDFVFEDQRNRNTANGYAGLDSGGLVAAAQLGTGGAATDCLLKNQTYAPCAAGGSGTVSANNTNAGAMVRYPSAAGSTTVDDVSGATLDAVGNETLAQGALTSDTPAFSETTTYNAGGVAFTNWVHSITCTASAANTVPWAIKVGGSTIFSAQFLNANCANPQFTLSSATTDIVLLGIGETGSGFGRLASGILEAQAGGSRSFGWKAAGLGIFAGNSLAWSSSASNLTTFDTSFCRMAAGFIAASTSGTCANQSGIIKSANTQIVSGADYTNATTTPSTVVGWTLPATAKTWSFECNLVYQSSASTATLALSINAQQAPTYETATGTVYTTLTGTETDATITSTSAGNVAVITGATPNATVTNYKAKLTGSIEASATSGTFNIQAAAGGVGTVTILRGSACTIN